MTMIFLQKVIRRTHHHLTQKAIISLFFKHGQTWVIDLHKYGLQILKANIWKVGRVGRQFLSYIIVCLEYNNLHSIIIQMISKTKSIIILLALSLAVSSFYIIPLRAGTIKITDQQLRSTKRIERTIDLKLSKEQYLAHKDTAAIASITSLAIDQYLNFYFLYDVICPSASCYLNFTLFRKNQKMNEKFVYHIAVDYFIARGLKVYDINVTEYQTHMQLMYLKSYNQKNEMVAGLQTIPTNNADAWHMLMFPAGFTNVTLLSKIRYNFIISEHVMYVIHYEDQTNGHGQEDHMGWIEDTNNILYRVVFVPPSYLKHVGCLPKDMSHLKSKYKLSCNGKDTVKWFYGFKATGNLQMQGEFFDLKSGFSFSLGKSPSDYGLLAFPFQTNDQFIDERAHEYKWDVQKEEAKTFVGFMMIFGLVIAIGVAVKCAWSKYYRKAKNAFKELTMLKKTSEETISSQKEVKNSIEASIS